MDCDDVMLLLASRELRTLTGSESTRFHAHLESCVECQKLHAEPRDDEWRWLTRLPADALDDREILILPTVDPIVFEASSVLASGGMGKVTRAFDRRLGREVAIKETLEDTLRARFEREVRITARLQHPAIVPIYEAGAFPGGASFYTMRLVPGRNLEDAIADAPTLQARLALMPHIRALADALAYAHHERVIHRDLKPSNVLVGAFGETIVIDWGLAKELDHPGSDPAEAAPRHSNPALTRVGTVLGTPCFLSPGQAAGAPADATDDVYALGAILYHLLAGAPPYWDLAKHETEALIAATLAGPPTPIAQLAPDAPADLRALVERAMARDRAERFPTAKELVEELARFDAGQLLASRQYTLRELIGRWLHRHRRAVAVGVVGLVAAVALLVMWTRNRRAAEELALRERGSRLTALYSDVSKHAAGIDREFLAFETALEGLGTAVSWALAAPEPPPVQPLPTPTEDPAFYTVADFAKGSTPPDYKQPSAYRWPVSVEYPVVAFAPTTKRDQVRPKVQRLYPLREHIRQMVVDAVDNTQRPADIDAFLRARRSPIDYAYIDLPEAVHMVWPGNASLRPDYDVTTSSFYQNSNGRRGTRWGTPYIDSSTDKKDDLVLPCTRSVWSPAGEFVAVVGAEITVTKLVDTQLELPLRKTLRASLVDMKTGGTVVDSANAGKLFPASGKDEAVVLPPFDLPEVAAAIHDGRVGTIETTRDGRPIVVAYTLLDTIGWYYVVEVDAASLGAP